jgi:hypothetical protein
VVSAVFCYTFSVGLLIRNWVLPDLFPLLHGGEGFFAGGDSISHHQNAARLAEEIEAKGWGVWSLKPAGEPLVGLLSAVYALFGKSLIPWLVINSMCHAASAELLRQVINKVWNTKISSILSVLPFVVFPTAAYWYSQILKDGIFILGSFMFVYGAMAFVSNRATAVSIFVGSVLLLAGIGVIWVVRSYILIAFGAFAALLALSIFFSRRVFFCGSGNGMGVNLRSGLMAIISGVIIVASLDAPTKFAADFSENLQPLRNKVSHCDAWNKSDWVPRQLDQLAYSLEINRRGYFWYKGASGSLVDSDVCLNNFIAFLNYMPRALQLGLFAPFPSQWVESGMAAGSGSMRKLAGLEMVIIYSSMIGVLIGVLVRWKSPEWWLMLSFSLYFLLLYGLVTPNIGALHRMRYGFLMFLVAMGVAEIVSQWIHSRRQQIS